MVVSNLFFETIFFEPVLIKTNAPVPKVLFTDPLEKQHCPIAAACWSPATPQIGMDLPIKDLLVKPKSSAEFLTLYSTFYQNNLNVCIYQKFCWNIP